MPFIGAHSTVSALQMRSGLRQSWQTPSVWQGVFLPKRAQFCTDATFRARQRALSKSGHSLFVPATM